VNENRRPSLAVCPSKVVFPEETGEGAAGNKQVECGEIGRTCEGFKGAPGFEQQEGIGKCSAGPIEKNPRGSDLLR